MVAEKSAGREGTLSLQTRLLHTTGWSDGRAALMETETARQANRPLPLQGGAVHLKKAEWPRVSGTAAQPSDSVTGCCGTSGEKLQRKGGSAVGNSDTSLSFSPSLGGSRVKERSPCPCCLFEGRRVGGGHVYRFEGSDKMEKTEDAGNDSQSSGTPPSALCAQHTTPFMLRVLVSGHLGSTSPCEWSRTGPGLARPILNALRVLSYWDLSQQLPSCPLMLNLGNRSCFRSAASLMKVPSDCRIETLYFHQSWGLAFFRASD